MGGMTSLLLLLLVVSTVANLQKRIFGGQRCNRPYHVKLTDSDMELVCGGSLIGDQWILTAAHCWRWDLNAVLGTTVMRIIAPPVMYGDNNNMLHDIMLLRLPGPVRIAPVAPPDCNNRPPLGSLVQMAGHGSTTAGPNNERDFGESPDLHCANIEVVDCHGLRNTLHRNDLPVHVFMSHQHLFCGQTPGVDACHGDSGGAVVYKINGIERIYGVFSVMGNSSHVCVEPVGFMDVCAYWPWIRGIIPRP